MKNSSKQNGSIKKVASQISYANSAPQKNTDTLYTQEYFQNQQGYFDAIYNRLAESKKIIALSEQSIDNANQSIAKSKQIVEDGTKILAEESKQRIDESYMRNLKTLSQEKSTICLFGESNMDGITSNLQMELILRLLKESPDMNIYVCLEEPFVGRKGAGMYRNSNITMLKHLIDEVKHSFEQKYHRNLDVQFQEGRSSSRVLGYNELSKDDIALMEKAIKKERLRLVSVDALDNIVTRSAGDLKYLNIRNEIIADNIIKILQQSNKDPKFITGVFGLDHLRNKIDDTEIHSIQNTIESKLKAISANKNINADVMAFIPQRELPSQANFKEENNESIFITVEPEETKQDVTRILKQIVDKKEQNATESTVSTQPQVEKPFQWKRLSREQQVERFKTMEKIAQSDPFYVTSPNQTVPKAMPVTQEANNKGKVLFAQPKPPLSAPSNDALLRRRANQTTQSPSVQKSTSTTMRFTRDDLQQKQNLNTIRDLTQQERFAIKKSVQSSVKKSSLPPL